MKEELELLNADGLDESISNAGGCGLPPVCLETRLESSTRRECKRVFGKEVCVNVPVVKRVTNQDCIDKKNRYKECREKEGKSGNIFQNIGSQIKNVTQQVGSGVKNVTQQVSSGVKNLGQEIKKKTTSLKEKVGKVGKKFRNGFRGILRKDIQYKLKNNIHGISTRLYPAISSESEIKNKKFKKSYIQKSEKVYSELLSKWKKLGGSENDLRSAILDGAKKRRFAKSPYKSFSGINDSYGFYQYFSSADGVDMEEVPTEQEKQKGIRGFFAWLLGLFKKNNANENPYEEGTAEAKEYSQDVQEDNGNEPAESEANNEVIGEIMTTANEDDAGGETDETKKAELEERKSEEGGSADEEEQGASGKILGMEKKTFYIAAGIVAVAAIGFAVYKLRKK